MSCLRPSALSSQSSCSQSGVRRACSPRSETMRVFRNTGLSARLRVFAGACALAVGGAGLQAQARPVQPTNLDHAEHLLLVGRADEATVALQAVLATNPGNGAAHLLLCRVYLSEALSTPAATECEAALGNGLAQNSDAQDWAGRALGARAAHAGMLSGLRLAGEVRSAFEAAFTLNPGSQAAAVDLGQYYTSAPAIVGGGNEKALALAARIEHAMPEIAHRIRAMAAEKRDDLVTAEREFQAEAAVGQRPGALVDLATYYSRRGQPEKAGSVAQIAIAHDRLIDENVVEAAGVLSDSHRPDLAEAALRSYLSRGLKSDQAPVFAVHTQLGTLFAARGEKAAARAEFQLALALAAQYAPAQKGLDAL